VVEHYFIARLRHQPVENPRALVALLDMALDPIATGSSRPELNEASDHGG
jgi:hypothetical protein